jgi:flavin-binding protein dodecin
MKVILEVISTTEGPGMTGTRIAAARAPSILIQPPAAWFYENELRRAPVVTPPPNLLAPGPGSLLPWNQEELMNHVYKITELTGSSPKSMEDAVNQAVARASKTLRNLRWFEVTETRGHIEKGKIDHWQVTIKIGFTLEDEA